MRTRTSCRIPAAALVAATVLGAAVAACGEATSPGDPPIASFSYDPLPPVAGEMATFTGTATDPDGTVIGWEWDFGDGSSASGQAVSHTFAAPDSYTVTLTVTDDASQTADATGVVAVAERIMYDAAAGRWSGAIPRSDSIPNRVHISLQETGVTGAEAGMVTYWVTGWVVECIGTWPLLAAPSEGTTWTVEPDWPSGCPRPDASPTTATLSYDATTDSLTYEDSRGLTGTLARPEPLTLTPLLGEWAGTAVDPAGEFPVAATFSDSTVLEGTRGGGFIYWYQGDDPAVDDPACYGDWVALVVDGSTFHFAEFTRGGQETCPAGAVQLVLEGDSLLYSFDDYGGIYPAEGTLTRQDP